MDTNSLLALANGVATTLDSDLDPFLATTFGFAFVVALVLDTDLDLP